MCYSARCCFEDSIGGCRVRSFDKFREQIGEPACYVGGMPDDTESAEYIESNKERFNELRKQPYEKKLVW